jgi:hypothetical protein
MDRKTCARGHFNRSEAKFCDTCGVVIAEGVSGNGIHFDSSPSDLAIMAYPVARGDEPVRNILDYGNNHRMMALATQPFMGQVLSASEIGTLTASMFPNFNLTSCLPNDHGQGNRSSCNCAGTPDRLFDREDRGKYRVRDRETSSLEQDPLPIRPLIDIPTPLSSNERVMFSEWLLSEALIEIGNRLPRGSRLTIVSGSTFRPGRYPAIGMVLRGTGETWALGLDRNADFVIGEEPVKLPYIGWRGGSTTKGSGSEGRHVHQALKEFFPGPEWLAPHRWWSTHRELPVRRDGLLMSATEYKEFVITTFVESYLRLTEAVAGQRITPIPGEQDYDEDDGIAMSMLDPTTQSPSPRPSSPFMHSRTPLATTASYGLNDLEAGISIWGRKAISSEWPRDFHNEMYVTEDMRHSTQPFTRSWWSKFIMPRVGTWRAYRPATKADIERWASTELGEMAYAYEHCVVPYLETPFEELNWDDLKMFTEVVARAKRNSAGGVQASPVFRSKVCHWIAPRLFPVADQEVLEISDPYETYWKQVQREWAAIPMATRHELIQRLSEEIARYSRYDVADHYPFEVKIVELCRIGRSSKW